MGGILGGLVGSLGLTVPSAPSAPSVSSPNANQDNVGWTAPSNGGSPILLYYWESDDGKSGSTVTTSVVVSQEAGTGQKYRVRAQNAVGLGDWSPYSAQITTTFSFAPFSFAPAPVGTCTNCPSSRNVFSVPGSQCGSSLGYFRVCYNTVTGVQCSSTFQSCVGSGC
jgi:hypothetical protein